MINNERFHGVVITNNQKIEPSNTFYLNKYTEFRICFQSILDGKNLIESIRKNSLVFSPAKKITVSIEINNKMYELEMDRRSLYQQYINYLSDLLGIIPWEIPKLQ